MDDGAAVAEVAAFCLGVSVPQSPFLTPRRVQRIEAGLYEGEEIAGALAVIRDGDRVLELGAGIGVVGAIIAANRDIRLLSFEANPALLPWTLALYRMNDLQDRIELRNALLLASPDRPASLPFQVHNSYLGSSLALDPARSATQVDVPTEAWDAVMADFRPDVLVMDIEGGEADLLAHADLSGLRAVVLEMHPKVYGIDGLKACKRRLKEAGFAKVEGQCSRTVWAVQRVA